MNNFNEVEEGMISVMHSEHCSYKSSRPILKAFSQIKSKRVLIGLEQDAGVVDIGDGYVVVFKIESHNHPSSIEPFHGAATGIGGIIRDILCMGVRPILLLDPLRFGSLEKPHNRWLMKEVVGGIVNYGNCSGIPTLGGDIEFDESFDTNCLVNVACVGVGKVENIKPSQVKDVGDLLILVGTTGRDGIHGVTFASRVITEESEADRPAVQIGDPFAKKVLIEATLEAIETGFVNGLKDLGGGGLTCATSEMAGAAEKGVEIHLEKVPLREENLSPYEIMISESQERMLFCVAPSGKEAISKILDKYNLSYACIGHVTDTGRVLVFNNGTKVADLPAKLLSDPPVIHRTSSKPKIREISTSNVYAADLPILIEKKLYSLLESGNIASRRWIYTHYDHEVGVRTILKPNVCDVAVLRILGTKKAIAVKSFGNSVQTYLSPYDGAAGAVAEACRYVASVGAKPVAMSNCCNYGSPENPEVFWEFSESVRGMVDACKVLDTPCTGGNVSFYNEDEENGIIIKPSPVVVILGVLEDQTKAVSMNFKNPDDSIIAIGNTVTRLDLQREKKTIDMIVELIDKRLLTASIPCSRGGLGVSVAKMCISGDVSALIRIPLIPSYDHMNEYELLFDESHSRFMVSASEDNTAEIIKFTKQKEIPARIIGKTNNSQELAFVGNFSNTLDTIRFHLPDLKEKWEKTFPSMLG